jgi:hypothetical protein
MKKTYMLLAALFVSGLFLGFSNSDNPKKTPFDYSGPSLEAQLTKSSNNYSTGDAIYFIDNFDGANDTNALKARGYLVFYRGSGPQGVAATWFQGNATVFSSFNGPTTGYVAANFQVVTGTNNIDSWLVLPDMDVVAGDIIRFRCRSVLNSTFPDSLSVMYNDLGGMLPESVGWVELGRFKASIDGNWEPKSFVAPTQGHSARFAIRYNVINGGPTGANADFIGIDALEVEGQGVLPVELSSFVSVISGNDVTLNWSTSSELNNSGFEIERSTGNQWMNVGFVSGNGTTSSANIYTFTDRNVNSGNYNYRLKQVDFNGNFEYFNLNNEVIIGVPSKFELSQNYPNPFNPSTRINYQLPNDGNVKISVFDNSGKEVMTLTNGFKAAGYYSVDMNASALSSGVYFYHLTAGDFSAVKKMLLVK